MITLQIHKNDFNPQNLILVFAALMFASLDILNKKFISKESMINMLFYSSLFTAALSFPLSLYNWKSPLNYELALFLLLGVGANLILFCLLKAFRILDASAVAPYRYLELIISGATGYLFFGETITKSTIYGAIIIIPATLFIIYSEKVQKTNV
jgi:S-adenosylmethionine uptake transporter